MNEMRFGLLFATALLPNALLAQPVPGDLNVEWNPGAEDCAANPQPPLQVHRYDAHTFILRQNLCADFEAPLLYLLIGDKRALLIDSGAVEDAASMPLAKTIADLLPRSNGASLPLLVAHTHRHSDHRAGDAQLAKLPGAEIVPIEHEDIVKYYGFENWYGKVAIHGEEHHLLIFPRNTKGPNSAVVVLIDAGNASSLQLDHNGTIIVED